MTKRKVMLDTNAVLRFITDDDRERSRKVSELLNTADCIVPIGYANVNDNSVFTFDNDLKRRLLHKAYS